MTISWEATRWAALWGALITLDVAVIVFGSDFLTTAAIVIPIVVVIVVMAARETRPLGWEPGRQLPDFLTSTRSLSDEPLWDRDLDG